MHTGDERRHLTGSTGTIGSRVVGKPADRRLTVQAARGDPGWKTQPDAEATIEFDCEWPETWAPAFESGDRVVLVRSPSIGRVGESNRLAVDATERMGIEQVVELSVLGPDHIPLIAHRRIEKHSQRTSIDESVVRHSRSIGRPRALTPVMAGLSRTARLEMAGRIGDDVSCVPGRPPTDLSAWVAANRDAFELTVTKGS